MVLQLRQICLATGDLEGVAAQIEVLFGQAPCFTDPDVARFGARNLLFQFGTDFLELIAPTSPKAPLQRFLDRQGGDGGYMAITQVASAADQQAIRDRATAAGIRIAWELRHRGADFLQWNPADTGGSFLETSFDHAGQPEGDWSAAGGAIGPATPFRLTGITVRSPEPAATAARWGMMLGLVPEDGARLVLRNADIAFAPPTEEGATGLTRIELHSPEAPAILERATAMGLDVKTEGEAGAFPLCGVEIALRP